MHWYAWRDNKGNIESFGSVDFRLKSFFRGVPAIDSPEDQNPGFLTGLAPSRLAYPVLWEPWDFPFRSQPFFCCWEPFSSFAQLFDAFILISDPTVTLLSSRPGEWFQFHGRLTPRNYWKIVQDIVNTSWGRREKSFYYNLPGCKTLHSKSDSGDQFGGWGSDQKVRKWPGKGFPSRNFL